ncbi:MAG: hypothetical protein H6694_00130 [Candidatus Latescibacteria bacterium]|nr:hypothetical protein [Candidatus Latescibacterota bacterium]
MAGPRRPGRRGPAGGHRGGRGARAARRGPAAGGSRGDGRRAAHRRTAAGADSRRGRPQRASLAAQLADADARHARFAILLGEEELAAGVVTVKDLDSGAQRALPEDDLLDLIQAWSAGARPASRP